MYQIDWEIVLFVAGALFLVVVGLAGFLLWRRARPRASQPERTLYGTIRATRKQLGLPPLAHRAAPPPRVPVQPGAPPAAPYPHQPPAPPQAPQAPPPPYGYPPPQPAAPYQQPPQAAYPHSPAPPPYPGAPAAPQGIPTKLAPVPGVAPGAGETFVGRRLDKTLFIRGGVKVMVPKRERNLMRLVPVMAVLAAGAGIYLGYRFLFADNRVHRLEREDHVGGRLTGERLVPPPDLPPSFFRNAERPELVELDRNWNHLNPEFAQAVLRVMKRMEGKGRPIALLEGFRSAERQTKLSQMGYHVTRAAAYQSQHQFGLAADLAPLKEGRISISERDPWTMESYQMMGQAAAAEGLVWGGTWTSLRDFGHVEARKAIR